MEGLHSSDDYAYRNYYNRMATSLSGNDREVLGLFSEGF